MIVQFRKNGSSFQHLNPRLANATPEMQQPAQTASKRPTVARKNVIFFHFLTLL